MLLSNLKFYLAEHKRVPIGDLVNHFDSEADAIRGMLELFIHKGLVRRLGGGGECGGCQKCGAIAFESYEWTGR